MILKASQRSGATQLALHLLNDENEHVEVHEVRGFIADDVKGAFKESQAVALGTRCRQHLFSLSLNPPQNESVAVEVFEQAITDIENKMGIANQPRVIIFHEKEGRRHCHVVWSRIDSTSMKAVHLPFYKMKLQEISRRLYLEHGWKMPDGLRDKTLRNPLNYSLEEWQQAKRAGIDPKALKAVIQECWNMSDSQKAFANALQEQGFVLAKGDRRGFVVVNYQGEVYAIARSVGIKTKEVKARLGKPDNLPSVAEAKAQIADRMTDKLTGFIADNERKSKSVRDSLNAKKQKLVNRHQKQRKELKENQDKRQVANMQKRANRFRKGLRGLWDKIRGRHAKIKAKNSLEIFWQSQQDAREKQNLIDAQLAERQILQKQIQQMRFQHTKTTTKLYRDIGFYLRMEHPEPSQKPRKNLSPTLKL